jgi:hypothetical protein
MNLTSFSVPQSATVDRPDSVSHSQPHPNPIACYNGLATMDTEWVGRAGILAEIAWSFP